MKNLLLGGCLLFSTLAFSLKTTPLQFTLSGKINMVDEPAKMILQYKNGSESVKDTVVLSDGALKASDNPRMISPPMMKKYLRIEIMK